MPNVNKTGLNLNLLGFSSKREYFGGVAVVFRQLDTYSYEYTDIDLGNSAGLSPTIVTAIKAAISNFSGDVTIRGLDIPADSSFLQEQIRTSKYNITVEVRKSIGASDAGIYNGISYLTISAAQALNNFSENFSFDNAEDSQKFNHSVNFELRTGDRSFAQYIASGLLSSSEPTTLGLGVLSGYLGIYNDTNSRNYYTETYDSLRNTYSFQKTKNLYKISGANYTYDISNRFEYGDGNANVSDEIKVKGKIGFEEARAGMESLLANSYTRCSTIYNSYKNLMPLAASGTLFSTPLKTVKKYNVQALSADCSQIFTDNPLYRSNFKQDQTINLVKDSNGVVRITNQYNFTLLKNVTGDMDSAYSSYFSGQTASTNTDVGSFYTANKYSRSINQISVTAKSPRRKRAFGIDYEYSDDPRNFVTLTNLTGQSVSFKNVDYRLADAKPKDHITEYKVINKPQTLVNYAYQQSPGSKTVTLTAIRYRPLNNQLTNFTLPDAEVKALYKTSLDMLVRNFIQLNGLNYYLANLSFNVNADNRIELTATINYTKKKYA